MKRIVGASASPKASLAEIRGRAINNYALLEQALCRLLWVFTGMRPQAAATLFFKIGNARYRNDALDKLKKQKLNKEYARFWNSALSEIGGLDSTRNQIVHWHVATSDNEPDGHINRVLRPPNFWARNPDTPELTAGDLMKFMRKAEFIADCLHYFAICITDPNSLGADLSAWLEIFEQPLTYPPPPDHLLSQNRKEPLIPPRPFRW